MPLRGAAWLGFFSTGGGCALGLWAVSTKVFHIPSPRGWVSTVALILFVGGVQLLILGIIGEYLSRVYDEVRRRPLYIVRSRVGIVEGVGQFAGRDQKPRDIQG
jgi:dolichol-phosphate mannosyltransferase